MVVEGDLTGWWPHHAMCRWSVIKLYSWNLYGFINHCQLKSLIKNTFFKKNPERLEKKKKKKANLIFLRKLLWASLSQLQDIENTVYLVFQCNFYYPISCTWLRFFSSITRKRNVSFKVTLMYERVWVMIGSVITRTITQFSLSLKYQKKQHSIINRNIVVVSLMCEHLQISLYL